MRDWSWLSRKDKPREIRPASYVFEKLPESEWSTCPSCGGAGSYYSEGDLHRSPGVIPCQNHHCYGGTIKSKSVRVRKPVYRVKAKRAS